MVQVSRRRRAEADEDLEDDEDEEEAPRARRATKSTKKVTRRRDTVKAARRPVVEDDDEEETDEDDEDDFEEEDDEEEEAPRSRRRSTKSTTTRSRSRKAADDEDDEDEEEEQPRRARRSSKAQKRSGPPPGIRVGLSGAEATLKAGGGFDRLQLTSETELIKFLEDAPFASFRQHWVSAGQGNRPYTCIGDGCPLCDLGDRAAAAYSYNILHLSGEGRPKVKILQVGSKAYQAIKELSADRKTNKVRPSEDFWSVNKTGKKSSAQTNFRPVKERDIEDDWDEVLENFDLEELPEIIEAAKKHLYDYSVVQISTKNQLKEVARFLADDDEDEDD